MLTAIRNFLRECWCGSRETQLWDEYLDEGCIPVRRLHHPHR